MYSIDASGPRLIGPTRNDHASIMIEFCFRIRRSSFLKNSQTRASQRPVDNIFLVLPSGIPYKAIDPSGAYITHNSNVFEAIRRATTWQKTPHILPILAKHARCWSRSRQPLIFFDIEDAVKEVAWLQNYLVEAEVDRAFWMDELNKE